MKPSRHTLKDVTPINDAVLQLWREPNHSEKFAPKFYPSLRTNCLLFMGANPSLPDKCPLFLKRQFSNDDDYRKFYKWDPNWDSVCRAASLEKKAKCPESGYKKYFGPLNDIAVQVVGPDGEHEHIDAYFVREPNQRELQGRIEEDEKNVLGKEFWAMQLELTKQLIQIVAPVMIVCVNTLASKALKKIFLMDGAEMDSERGCYFVSVCGRTIPVFLGGTIQFGRLDDFSKERLIWHLRREWKPQSPLTATT